MRRRLADMIGNPAYRVTINTFHGFCNDVIRRYPEDFPRIVGSRSITEVEQVSIIEALIDEGDFTLLRPFGDRFLYVRDIVSSISELKREGVTPERFAAMVAEEKNRFNDIPDLVHEKGAHKGKMKGDYQKLERKILKNEELARVYAGYQEMLTEKKQYDFSDMILEVLETLKKNPQLLLMLQEEYQYVLVDEHQDTNNAQNNILELLMSYHESPNLFVVGDEKQAIFRFQGASLENFYYFKTRFPGASLVTLTENYRSTQSILDNAEALLPGRESLKKNAGHGEKPIRIVELENESAERYFVVHDILKKISPTEKGGQGIPAEEIAILYRSNKDAFPIARDLDRLGISYSIESDQDLFSQSDVKKLLIIMQAVADFGNDMHMTSLLHLSLFDIDPLDAYKVLRSAADRKKYSLYDIVTTPTLLTDIELKDEAAVLTLAEKITRWKKESRSKDLQTFFEHIVRDSGILEDMLGSSAAQGNTAERFDAVHALFDEVRELAGRKPDATVADFFVYLETVKKHNLFLKRKNQIPVKGRVRLMTVHRSKGLEFGHVYIVRAIHGNFGGKIDRDRLPLIDSVYAMEAQK
jgi:DNA helicase-2/ATP-dependent DNA helicase PcrA